jgi:acyl carrier protein
VLLAHDSPGSKQQLQQVLRSRLEHEKELVLAPEFFAGIRARVPEIAAAELRLKKGPARNELTRFRYDVVLRVGELRPETMEMAELNWEWAALEDFSARISRYPGTVVRINRIPNARVCSEIAGAGWIDSLAVDPDDLMAACNRSGNQVELLVSRYGEAYFDAVIHAAATSPEVVRMAVEAGPSLPSGPLANTPAAAREREELGAELRGYLQPKLPAFMVPSAVIVIDSFPLTPNGKVDRRALESRLLPVQVESDNQTVAPRTEIERTVAGLWADVLGHVVLSVHDNFFEAGGNSLTAMQLLARIQHSFGVELSIKALFDCPTIAHVADQLAAAQSSSDQSGLEKVLRQIEQCSDQEVDWEAHRLRNGAVSIEN